MAPNNLPLKLCFIFTLFSLYFLNCCAISNRAVSSSPARPVNPDEANSSSPALLPVPTLEAVTQRTEETPSSHSEKRNLPSLSHTEIIQKAKALLPYAHHFITVKGKAILHFDDLNLDGISEMLMIGVKSVEPLVTDTLSNFSTLFSDTKKAYSFYLYIFTFNNENIVFNTSISLGKHFVYGGLSRISITKNSPIPFSINVVFQIQEGTEQEWLIFNGMTPTNLPVDSIKPDGQPNQDTQLRPVSQLSLKDTFLNHLLIKDIDKDGSIDIVLQERGEVEGIGNEAFLTWLKWNGTTFHEYASTNIVHNLRQFLSEVKRLILEKEWRKLLTYAFRLEDLYRYKQQNYSDSAIIFEALDFDHFFRQEDLATLTVINNIQDIIFPEILENPFIVQEEQGYSFNLSYRIESLNGTSHIGEIILYMVPNPFNKKQFYFVLP